MPGTTPRGYPFPLPTEPADGSPQIEALARAIDTDATAAAAKLALSGAYAIATGSWSAGVTGANVVNLTAISAQTGGFTLSGGSLVVPYAGTTLCVYWAGITATGSATQIWVGPNSGLSDNLAISGGGVQAARSAFALVLDASTVGRVLSRPTVYTAPGTGSAGTVRLAVAYLGIGS